MVLISMRAERLRPFLFAINPDSLLNKIFFFSDKASRFLSKASFCRSLQMIDLFQTVDRLIDLTSFPSLIAKRLNHDIE